jgi:hypothetical protein
MVTPKVSLDDLPKGMDLLGKEGVGRVVVTP